MTRARSLPFWLALLALASAAVAGELVVSADMQLAPLGGQGASAFGAGLGADGDTLVVGAPQDAAGRGFVYLFERIGGSWFQRQRIPSGDGGAARGFGTSVDLQGGRFVAVAAEASGAALRWFVFERAPGGFWSRASAGSVPAGGGLLDTPDLVALAGEAFAVGAPLDPSGAERGRVQVLRRDAQGGFALEQELVAFDAADGDRFGQALAFHERVLCVGSKDAVYVFERSGGTWALQQKLLDPLGTASGTFGARLALDGEKLLVGEPGDDAAAPDAGAAFVFERGPGGFAFQAELGPRDLFPAGAFGSAVDVQGERAVVASGGAGALHVFERRGGLWCRVADTCGQALGRAVALDGGNLLAGSAQPSVERVATHLVRPSLGTAYCVAGQNSLGRPARLRVSGTSVASDDDLVLVASDGVSGRAALLFYGPNAVQVPFGGGFRCVGPATRVQPPLTFDACGSLSRRLDLHAPPASNDITVQVPITMRFQLWYRDTPQATNLTDAVAVAFQ